MAADRTVTGAGFQLIIASGSISKKVQAAVVEGLAAVAANYKQQVIKNISLDDHTLKELRAMGYPYSVDMPADQPHDDRMVHEQSGKLKRSLRLTAPEETTSRRFSVYMSSSVPYMPFLLYGTSKMRPRRFHEKAMEDIKDRFWDPVLSTLKKVEHRIQTSIR